MSSKVINILGVTGSIGQSTAKVIVANPDHFNVQLVSAHSDVDGLARMAKELQASIAVIADEAHEEALKEALADSNIEVMAGQAALIDASRVKADITMAAIVGMAGLEPLMGAIAGSSAVAIANKEPLVAAGPIVLQHAEKHNTKLLPVDSEHNAIFQVFEDAQRDAIERIIITGSGGPFRTWALEDMLGATPEQAIAHPNWSMGAKISVDSATLVNKALEIVEAHYLFDMPAEKIDLVIHAQSVIHSMVEYRDGSVLAQMGASDMCTPIANVLAWPERLNTPGERLDFKMLKTLSFEEVDHFRFPAVKMAYECLGKGLYATAAMNAANEIAVAAFLDGNIGFLDIAKVMRHVIDKTSAQELCTLDDVLKFDSAVRGRAKAYITEHMNVTKMVS